VSRIYVGCATWAIGSANEQLLPPGPSNLARYARALTAAEVNSSFHRSHRHATWGRWARSVGPSFRFAVKLPKQITHERRLRDVSEPLAAFLAARRVARVAADPAVVPCAAEPGGWDGLRYFRLHGSPVTYRSPYPPEFLDRVAAQLRPGDWCIFDNTASGAALPNALQLLARLRA
jgi:uncharacterized protein YecE (DUF72 family)